MQPLPRKLNCYPTAGYIMANNNKSHGGLGRNLHMCFTGVKRSSSPHLPYPQADQVEDHEAQQDQHVINRSFSSSSSMFVKNFNSLYDSSATTNDLSKPSRIQPSGWKSKHRVTRSVDLYEDDDPTMSDPDLSTVYASQRFFFSSPGRSNSIFDSSSLSPPESVSPPEECEDNSNAPVVKDSVAVPTYSPDPYLDFRRSMQEMVEAKKLTKNLGDNWEYLHELLFCYLALNPKSTHKFIVGAFSDLVISLMTPESDVGHRRSRSIPGDGWKK